VTVLAPPITEVPPAVIVVPAGLTLAVLGGGVRMPLIHVVEVRPPPVVEVVQPAPVIAAVAPAPYVAPIHPRKQDRN
jgi:hypothetical protein